MKCIEGYNPVEAAAVIDFWINYLVPIFGWLSCMYMDNGSTSPPTIFESYMTEVISAQLSHLGSVGLAECTMKVVTTRLRKWVIQRVLSQLGSGVMLRQK